jgi:hypothetical protein
MDREFLCKEKEAAKIILKFSLLAKTIQWFTKNTSQFYQQIQMSNAV